MLNADGLLELAYDKTQFSSARELPRALQRDIAALRQLKYVIEHQPDYGGYALYQSPFGLSLSDEQLVTFATLQTSFRDSHTIHAHDISILLSHLAALLPAAQRQKLNRPPTFTLNLHETTDYRNADGHNLSQIEQAIRLGRQLEFLYCTPATVRSVTTSLSRVHWSMKKAMFTCTVGVSASRRSYASGLIASALAPLPWWGAVASQAARQPPPTVCATTSPLRSHGVESVTTSPTSR